MEVRGLISLRDPVWFWKTRVVCSREPVVMYQYSSCLRELCSAAGRTVRGSNTDKLLYIGRTTESVITGIYCHTTRVAEVTTYSWGLLAHNRPHVCKLSNCCSQQLLRAAAN